MDAHANFAYSRVATAPSPATSGTSLVVTAGEGVVFPATPFNATVWPQGAAPLASNAEIVRVTGISTDTLTIARTQEGTSARSIVAGDQIMASVTAKSMTDIEFSLPRVTVVTSDQTHAQNATLSNLTNMVFNIGASSTEIWWIEAFLLLNATSITPDFKFGWTFPTGCTMTWDATVGGSSGFNGTSTGNSPTGLLAQTATRSLGAFAGTSGATIQGMVYGGGTAGAVQLQWAQNVTDPTDIKILKGSLLRYTQIVA